MDDKKQAINGNFMQPVTDHEQCMLFCTKPMNNTEAQTSIKPTNIANAHFIFTKPFA